MVEYFCELIEKTAPIGKKCPSNYNITDNICYEGCGILLGITKNKKGDN